MAAESSKSPRATEPTAGQVTRSLTPEQRAQLRTRSREAREFAQVAAARCHELRAEFEARLSEQAQWRESFTRVPELRDSISRYARCLRDEGEQPQRMLLLVKEAVHEAIPSIETRQPVLDLAIGFAIKAYYDEAA